MIFSSSSTNTCLFVLRLVLRRSSSSLSIPRSFSTATLTPFPFPSDSTPISTSTNTFHHSSTSHPSPPLLDFLEPRSEADEYELASSLLPRRSKPLRPIPWPTLFPHAKDNPTLTGNASSSTPSHVRPCDLLARLVMEDRLEAAKKVYDELKALHTPIMCRKLYLDAALSSLDSAANSPSGIDTSINVYDFIQAITLKRENRKAKGKSGQIDFSKLSQIDMNNEKGSFLFWLNLYPNRPATSTYPSLKSTWLPISRRLTSRYAHDLPFLISFLLLSAQKGLLPILLPTFIHHFTLVAPPDVSRAVVEKAIEVYRASTTSDTSNSDDGVLGRKIVNAQVESWWNSFVRALVVCGWEAKRYLPPKEIQLDHVTIALLNGTPINSPSTRRSKSISTSSHSSSASSLKKIDSDPPLDLGPLTNPFLTPLLPRLKSAITSPFTSPAEVNDLQRALTSHPPLLAHFKNLFCRPPSTHRGRVAPTENQAKWWHAKILGLRDDGLFDDALKVFVERFLWIGLPPLPSSIVNRTGTEQLEEALIHPSIHEITTILPCILHSIRPSMIPSYHKQYLDLVQSPSFAPSLKPTPATHAAFVRAAGQHLGAAEAAHSVERIVEKKMDPGTAAWTGLMVCLLKTGETDAAMNLLDAMERRAVVSDLTSEVGVSADTRESNGNGKMKNRVVLRMPEPDERTYARLVGVFIQQGRREEAKALAKRMQLKSEEPQKREAVMARKEEEKS